MIQLSSTTILITGASSGIGQALAERYAAKGITLILTGRNADRLSAVGTNCENKGAEVLTHVLDVRNHEAMAAWIEEVDNRYPIDLVIANAGIGRGQRPDTWETTNLILQTDLYGVLNTVLPLIPRMKERGHGHIAVISSLAAYRAFPGRGAYSASKVAVMALCEDWRIQLQPFGVAVSTICPGFVKTRLTDQNVHPMPLMMSADQAAQIIIKGLSKQKAIIAFPWISFISVKLLQILPVGLADFIVKKISTQIS